MRARWSLRARAAVLGLAIAALLLGSASVAAATPPVALGAGYVVDDAGVLEPAARERAQERLAAFRTASGLDLWVVFVDRFTDPSSSEAWANQTALDNGLGPTQYLLAVATDSRQFYISGDGAGPVTGDQLGAIEQNNTQPALAVRDWAGAIDATAAGLADAVGGNGADGDGSTGETAGASGMLPVLAIGAVVVAGVVLVVWLLLRRRRAVEGTTEVPVVPTDELARRASAALVETDDAITTSAQELGFARAQFGDDATAEFAQTLSRARTALTEAFALQQSLDDEVPDTDASTRESYARITELCAAANADLDAKARAFDELRQLEQNAPEELIRVEEGRADSADAIDAADSALADLDSRYASEAISTVSDNPDQARARLEFAGEQLAEARCDIAAGRGGEAAVGIRAAEDAVEQARLLERAIGDLATNLAEGERRAIALLSELEADVSAASALADDDGRVAATISATTRSMNEARELLAAPARPLAALEALRAANEQIDTVLAAVRDEQARQTRARQQLDQALLQAHAQISAAEDYIAARRGAVGANARTRLAEARASLAAAEQLQSTDPAAALERAGRAAQLGAAASAAAQGDVGAFDGFGRGSGAGVGGSGGAGMLGAMLGGIVLNSLLDAGSRSSGGFGGFGGSRGGSLGGGRIRPPSFGGGGTRGRRGGGRF